MLVRPGTAIGCGSARRQGRTGDGRQHRPDVFYVRGIETDVIGRRLLEGGVELHELTPLQESLEGIFMGLTQDAVQYQSHDAHPSTPERRAA